VTLAAAGMAQAATLSFTDTVAMTTTNWNDNLTFSQFDPSLGTLTGINFLLEGDVLGNVRFESLDAQPADVHTYLQAKITLSRPDLSTIVVTTPVSDHLDSVTAFDGIIDFAGTSGRTYLGVQAHASNSINSPPPNSDLALFTGLGSIILPIAAEGTSLATGAGNIISSFQTEASARATVTYTYYNTPPVPEASSLMLLLMGGGAMVVSAGVRRFRK